MRASRSRPASSSASSSRATPRSRSSARLAPPPLRPVSRAPLRLHLRRLPSLSGPSGRPGSASSMASSGADVVQRVQEAVAQALDRSQLPDDRSNPGSGYPMVVAVSGGADSLCLLDAVVAVLPNARDRLLVGHVDHQLRPDSASDAEHVQRIAFGLGVSSAVATVNVPDLARSERLGIEEAARLARYRSLARFADELGTDTVLTGHTRDDSVETVVLSFLRGTGARGLSGIGEEEWLSSSWLGPTEDRPIGLGVIRPLLRVGRAETSAYCEARGIHWLTDESNADPAFTRNRVRAHLLPVLRTYNPSVDRALVRMSQVLMDEDAWMNEMALERWDEIRVEGAEHTNLTFDGWRRAPIPLQRRLVRLVAA